MSHGLRGGLDADSGRAVVLADGAVLLPGFAAGVAAGLRRTLQAILAAAPLRRMTTPGGRTMAVAMSNCGAAGWVSDRAGYRYSPIDPLTGRPWPPMPQPWAALAHDAAAAAGFAAFRPDACLINEYRAGTGLGLHQDRDERDFRQPIVSVSLGLPAVFLLGGLRRSDKARPVPLADGDVVVFGGAARLVYHGIRPLAAGTHPLWGDRRINLTFRRAW
jgi:alkylated DNA repair protein (DNA oxidative demethylase)